MIYLKKNKQEVLPALNKQIEIGFALLSRAEVNEPRHPIVVESVRRWFDDTVAIIGQLVRAGAATARFRLSFAPWRFAVTDSGHGVPPTTPAEVSQQMNHVRVPLSALVELLEAVENQVPDDSAAIRQIEETGGLLEEMHRALIKRMEEIHEAAIARDAEIRKLATFTYTNVEELYMRVVAEPDLKTDARKLLDTYGPRALNLAAQAIEHGFKSLAHPK